MHQPAWTCFALDISQVSLAPLPVALAKNKQEGHLLDSLVMRV